MKTFCLGDVHGGFKAMVQALERAKFDPEIDQLISLGDIADGWSETPQCVEYLLKCKNLIAIRGNHDEWTMQWLIYGNAQHIWLNQGGKATKEAYENMIMYDDFDIEKHRNFFKNQINYYIDEENRGFVHGGFTSKKGLGHEHSFTNYYWDRDLWQIALLSNANYEEGSDDASIAYTPRYKKHKEIFIGHTTTGNWYCKPHFPEYNDPNQENKNGLIVIPMKRCNVWNLDTGGGFEGKVTVMNVETKEYFQSDFVRTLYPNDAGRR